MLVAIFLRVGIHLGEEVQDLVPLLAKLVLYSMREEGREWEWERERDGEREGGKE